MNSKDIPVCAAKALSMQISSYLYCFTLAAYEDLAGDTPGAKYTKENGYDTFSAVILKGRHPRDAPVKTLRVMSVSTYARQAVLAIYFHMLDEVVGGYPPGEMNACTRLVWGAVALHAPRLNDKTTMLSKFLGSERAFSRFGYTRYTRRSIECVTTFVNFLKCVALKMANALIEKPSSALNRPAVGTILRGLADCVRGTRGFTKIIERDLGWIQEAARLTQAQFAELLAAYTSRDAPGFPEAE